VIEFLPGNTEAREEAEWIVNRLVENDIRSLPEDFLGVALGCLRVDHGIIKTGARRLNR